MSDAIREHIEELYADVQLQYEENIKALKQLEKTLLRSESDRKKAIRRVTAETGASLNVSNVNRVINAIRETPKSVDDLMEETGLSAQQVRGVLYAPKLQHKFVTNKQKGEKTTFKLKI